MSEFQIVLNLQTQLYEYKYVQNYITNQMTRSIEFFNRKRRSSNSSKMSTSELSHQVWPDKIRWKESSNNMVIHLKASPPTSLVNHIVLFSYLFEPTLLYHPRSTYCKFNLGASLFLHQVFVSSPSFFSFLFSFRILMK